MGSRRLPRILMIRGWRTRRWPRRCVRIAFMSARSAQKQLMRSASNGCVQRDFARRILQKSMRPLGLPLAPRMDLKSRSRFLPKSSQCCARKSRASRPDRRVDARCCRDHLRRRRNQACCPTRRQAACPSEGTKSRLRSRASICALFKTPTRRGNGAVISSPGQQQFSRSAKRIRRSISTRRAICACCLVSGQCETAPQHVRNFRSGTRLA